MAMPLFFLPKKFGGMRILCYFCKPKEIIVLKQIGDTLFKKE